MSGRDRGYQHQLNDHCLTAVPARLRLVRRAAEAGWNAGRTAQAWAELMRRLGYDRFVAEGGDVGAFRTSGNGYLIEQDTGGRQGPPPRRLGRARAVRDRDPGGVQPAA
jgi:hypothetical protein